MENSTIGWTHHTFSPWRGCTKVSAGCKNCYAEKMSRRNPRVLGIWGDAGSRPLASETYWRQPLAWNTAAVAAGQRHRVFCSSLADVFEDRPELRASRRGLFELIRQTPQLEWLLLTKRPENIMRLVKEARAQLAQPTAESAGAIGGQSLAGWLDCWASGQAPANVWLGTSAENQEALDTRIPRLLAAPAAVRFLSCEPLLGPLDLWPVLERQVPCPVQSHGLDECRVCGGTGRVAGVDWVIVGGESGPKARPMQAG